MIEGLTIFTLSFLLIVELAVVIQTHLEGFNIVKKFATEVSNIKRNKEKELFERGV